MTIAEQLRQEGKQSGDAEFLTHLLTQKFGDLPQTYLERIQQADVKKLLQWGGQVLKAHTIDDVFH